MADIIPFPKKNVREFTIQIGGNKKEMANKALIRLVRDVFGPFEQVEHRQGRFKRKGLNDEN